MAADPRHGTAALRNARRSVVRASGAEVRLAHRRHARPCKRLLLEVQECQPFAELAAERIRHAQLFEPLRDCARDHGRRMLVMRRQKPRAGGLASAAAPLAAVVELADDPRSPDAFLPVVELFLDLVLDELTLLLDDQNLLETFGEAPRALRLERPGHA